MVNTQLILNLVALTKIQTSLIVEAKKSILKLIKNDINYNSKNYNNYAFSLLNEKF